MYVAGKSIVDPKIYIQCPLDPTILLPSKFYYFQFTLKKHDTTATSESDDGDEENDDDNNNNGGVGDADIY